MTFASFSFDDCSFGEMQSMRAMRGRASVHDGGHLYTKPDTFEHI